MRSAFAATGCALVLLLTPAPAPAQEGGKLSAPSEAVQVIDGDTLEVDGVVVDLYGIDAPELGQSCGHGGKTWRCGLDAALALRKLIEVGRGKVRCTLWDTDTRPRQAVCEAAGRDLALTLVGDGSVVVRRDSLPEYLEAQARAKGAGLGLWRGPFALPWDWRSRTGLAEKDSSLSAAQCAVKGLVTEGDRRVYYVPTDAGYEQMKVDGAAGGRCFASDEAARQAGWQRPRR